MKADFQHSIFYIKLSLYPTFIRAFTIHNIKKSFKPLATHWCAALCKGPNCKTRKVLILLRTSEYCDDPQTLGFT